MLKSNNPYTLRIEEAEGITRYFVSFKDGQAIIHEIEIDKTLYKAFDDFRKEEKRQQNSFERHIEHSELMDGTLYDRAFRKPESVDDTIIRRTPRSQNISSVDASHHTTYILVLEYNSEI